MLLAITVFALIVALVMSASAYRLNKEEKRRAAARVAALSIAAGVTPEAAAAAAPVVAAPVAPAIARSPWPTARVAADPRTSVTVAPKTADIPLNEVKPARETLSHASGFFGAESAAEQSGSGGRQQSLAVAAAVMFVVLSLGLVWMMSAPRGTTAVAMGPNSPLELVSLRHDRQAQKLAVSGLVRNPAMAKPVERLTAVVFLFDRQGAFVTSGRANVDFLKLGSGDESPFVVSLDAPATVARYRVSFRTDEGVVPHVDKRGASPIAGEGEQPVSVSLK